VKLKGGMIESRLYVDLCTGNYHPRCALIGVPSGATDPRELWRVCVDYEGDRYVSLIGFPRKKDAELAKAGLESAGVTDALSMWQLSFEERCRIMLESMQW
jgi:hypothetical protein